MSLALYALTVGAFGIGVTEFVIMGLLLEIVRGFDVTIAAAGLLIPKIPCVWHWSSTPAITFILAMKAICRSQPPSTLKRCSASK